MSITKKMQSEGGKPSGLFGTLIGNPMKILHGNIPKPDKLELKIKNVQLKTKKAIENNFLPKECRI